ncbi:MAG: LysR family transcriptional regulator [SAR202 cluster bacterium]|nr:LysR family transcriptional regulator [SAR202 cluster bacterium]
MELPQLEAFLKAVEHRSFSRAATALGISQPSLSARIQTLEEDVGEQLFQRVGRGVRLTDAGRTFLPYAQRSLDALRSGREALDASRTASGGQLFIGAARSISAYVLPGILDTFHHRYPGVELSIKTGRSSQILEMVIEEGIQIGLSRALYHPDVTTTHLYDEEVVLVTHPDHPFAKAGSASIYEVASQPLIVYDKDSTYFLLIERVCREAGIVPNIQMDLDSIEATKKMIERGLGVSFLPRNALTREFSQGTLSQAALKEGHRITLPTAAMVRRGTNHSAILNAFLGLLNELYPQATQLRAAS